MKPEVKAYEWLLKIIKSCTDTFHFDGADNLIALYREKYPEDTENIDKLVAQRQSTWISIHKILI